MPRDPAPGLTLAWGVIPSGSNPIEIGRCSGWSHRPEERPGYAFDGAGSVGGRVKSHCSRSGVRPQCDLMPKAPSKTPDFGWKGTMQTDYLGVSLMHFSKTHRTHGVGARRRLSASVKQIRRSSKRSLGRRFSSCRYSMTFSCWRLSQPAKIRSNSWKAGESADMGGDCRAKFVTAY